MFIIYIFCVCLILQGKDTTEPPRSRGTNNYNNISSRGGGGGGRTGTDRYVGRGGGGASSTQFSNSGMYTVYGYGQCLLLFLVYVLIHVLLLLKLINV